MVFWVLFSIEKVHIHSFMYIFVYPCPGVGAKLWNFRIFYFSFSAYFVFLELCITYKNVSIRLPYPIGSLLASY